MTTLIIMLLVAVAILLWVLSGILGFYLDCAVNHGDPVFTLYSYITYGVIWLFMCVMYHWYDIGQCLLDKIKIKWVDTLSEKIINNTSKRLK